MSIWDRLKNAWNVFRSPPGASLLADTSSWGGSMAYRPTVYSKGSIIDTIVTRIAIDFSMVEFHHVKMDDNPKTEKEMTSGLNNCITLEANIDQSSIEFMQDLIISMMDEGVVAVVPVDTNLNPNDGGFDILSMRVGRITQWYPKAVRVQLYNDATGRDEEVLISKSACAIIENPLYSVLNAPNSTLKRLVRKLQLLDTIDENNASNKLDLILQLPYVIKHETKQKEAEQRINAIQEQLTKNKYGIAYIDGTERITQLNRAVENHLLEEIEYLSNELFNQLGLTKRIFDGTAPEEERRSYYDRTINPIAKRVCLEFKRKFLTKTARTQGQDIVYYVDPFKLVTTSALASMADTLRRNSILTSNEIRQLLGFQPSDDPRANELFNPNMADNKQGMDASSGGMNANSIAQQEDANMREVNEAEEEKDAKS